MLKTFALSFRLRTAYKVNSIIWSLKGLPIIRRLLPASLYSSPVLKVLANIISGFAEFFRCLRAKRSICS